MDARKRKTKLHFLFITTMLIGSAIFVSISAVFGVLEGFQIITITGSILYPTDNPSLRTEGVRILDSSGNDFVPFGINTFCTAFPASWTTDRPPEQPTPSLLDRLKTLKVNLVRITISKQLWDAETGYKEHIDRWVSGLAEREIRSFLDFNFPWYIGSGRTLSERFEWFYEAMTTSSRKQEVFGLYDEWIDRYGSNKWMVGIGLMNEPMGFPPDYSFPITSDELNTAWRNFVIEAVQHISSQNSDLIIFVNGGGVNWGTDLRPFMGNAPATGNVVYTFHHYPEYVLRDGEDYPFTDNYVVDYQNGDFTAGYNHMKEYVSAMGLNILDDDVPVLVEEFGFGGEGFYSNWEQTCDDFYKLCNTEGRHVGIIEWALTLANGPFGVFENDWSTLSQHGQKWAENLNLYAI